MPTPQVAVPSGWWQLGLHPVRTADGVLLNPSGFVGRRWGYLFLAVVTVLMGGAVVTVFAIDAVNGTTAGYPGGATPLGQSILASLVTVPFIVWGVVGFVRNGRGLGQLAGAEPVPVRLVGAKAGRRGAALILAEADDHRPEPGLAAFDVAGGLSLVDLARRPEQALTLYLAEADRDRRPGLTAPGLCNLGRSMVQREQLRLEERRGYWRSQWPRRPVPAAPTRLPAAIQMGRQTLWVISDRAGPR